MSEHIARQVHDFLPELEWAYLIAEDIFEKLGNRELQTKLLHKDVYGRSKFELCLIEAPRQDRKGMQREEKVVLKISRPDDPLYSIGFSLYGQLKFGKYDLKNLGCSVNSDKGCQRRLRDIYQEYGSILIDHEAQDEDCDDPPKIEGVIIERKLDPITLAFSHASRLPRLLVKITSLIPVVNKAIDSKDTPQRRYNSITNLPYFQVQTTRVL